MAAVAMLCALVGAACVALPGAGKLCAVGLGIFAVAAGLRAFRRIEARPAARLLGAAGAAVGLAALALGGAKVALTLVAVEHVARLAPPSML
jgi:hypothetical protein